MNVNDKTLQAIAAGIKFREVRQEVISSNIANSETPGYRSKRLHFEEALSRALDVDGNQSLKVNNSKHYDVGSGGFDNLEPTVSQDSSGIVNESGNNVNREDEMARMAQNKIMYDTLIHLANKKLGLRKYLIQSER